MSKAPGFRRKHLVTPLGVAEMSDSDGISGDEREDAPTHNMKVESRPQANVAEMPTQPLPKKQRRDNPTARAEVRAGCISRDEAYM